jgi:hypothetical protein
MAKGTRCRAKTARREALRARTAERQAARQGRRAAIREGLGMWHEQLRRALEASAAARQAARRDERAFRMRGGARLLFRFGSGQPAEDSANFRPAVAVAWIRSNGEVIPVDPTPNGDTDDLRARDGWEDDE